MRSLISGADGFVARHLRTHLESCGDDVFGFDRDCDITDRAALQELMKQVRPEVIYHLAALTHVGDSWEMVDEFTRVNVAGTENILESAWCEVPGAVTLVVSSAEVYGVVKPEDLPVRETHPRTPMNPYAASKVASEDVARFVHQSRGQRVLVARPFNHIGPGQASSFVIPALVRRLLNARETRENEVRVGDLSTRRDFTDVRDVVRAYRLLVDEATSGEVYNVASGHDVLLRDVADDLVRRIAPEVSLVVDEQLLRPSENPLSVGSFEKLQLRTGWSPQIPLEHSLRDVIEEQRALGRAPN